MNQSAQSERELLCPSARAVPGAILVGVVGPDGKVGYVSPRIQIDADFVTRASGGRAPEKRFRFAGRCVEAGCVFWQNERCHVVDSAVDVLDGNPDSASQLPRCAIRSDCRWFAQAGSHACRVCPLVVTDVSERSNDRQASENPRCAAASAQEAGSYE